MKHLSRFWRIAALFAAFLLPAACQQAAEPGEAEESRAVSRVRMDLQIDRWDAATKAEETEFGNGSRIYTRFVSGNRKVTFNLVIWDGEWYIEELSLNPDYSFRSEGIPDLDGFAGGHCECYFFESRWSNAGDWFGDETHFGINLGPEFAIYEDPEAIYGIADGELTLRIHLKPKNGRFRLVSPVETWPTVYGMSHYTYFDLNTFTFNTTSQRFWAYAAPNVSDHYFYGFFSDPERKTLTFGDWPYFSRSFADDILAPGCSSWMDVPTETVHHEWYSFRNELYGDVFELHNFRMRYIVPGRFQMGGDDARPVHTVTLTKAYYISDTEITRNMWYQVMGKPADYVNSDLPVTGKTWDEVQEFIAALRAKSGLDFRLPTEAEWEFAARGGLRSEGYRYSGSNNKSDVAVQDGNWSVQRVRTKEGNEWELFDMSGNAAEWVSDWYGAYPNGAVVDPTGPASGSIHVRRGGNRGQDERYLTVSFRDTDSDLSMTGFRLALDASKSH